MNLYETIRVLYYNWKVIVLSCIIPPIAIYFLTDNMEKKYQSSAMLYTGIASGYNIESAEGTKLDYHVVNNAFDNLIALIKSRETLEEVGITLLSRHLMKKKPDYRFGQDAFDALAVVIPMEERNTWVNYDDFDITLSRVHRKYREGDPAMVDLILKSSSPYSLKSLSGIEAKRVKSSDMVQLIYQYRDPGICQESLEVLLKVFTERYKNLKGSETTSVVAYFERRLKEIKAKLTGAENKLTEFRSSHRVINYGEQTKAIAIKKQNALDEFSKSKMNQAATEAALKKIEEKLKIREDVLDRNAKLLSKKRELTELTRQIALVETSDSQEDLSELLNKQKSLKEEINNYLHEVFKFTNTKEGLPSRQLLNDWLSNLITAQREQVLTDLYTNRLAELNAQYDEFAPLGSTLDRYEREIDVHEREFLEVLHGLNMAKLKQQNIELSSTLNILDTPKFPTQPLAGKRLLLVIIGFLVGFSISVGTIVLLELLDSSLRDPSNATQITGLGVLGAMPIMVPKLEDIETPLINQAIDGLLNQIRQTSNEPKVVLFSSVLEQTGKTYILEKMGDKLLKKGYSVIHRFPGAEQEEHYSPDMLASISKGSDLIPKKQWSNCDIILIEIPSLVNGNVPYELIKNADLHILVERADHAWSEAHIRAVEKLQEAVPEPHPLLFLNALKPRFLEKIVGVSPNRRNPVKSFMKRMLKFEFAKNTLPL